MKKTVKFLLAMYILSSLIPTVGLLRDKTTLRNDLIRFHVVGASNSEADQTVKLQVRDAVIDALSEPLAACADVQQAKAYLACHLEDIRKLANDTLANAGFSDEVQVTIAEEPFPRRDYDTFSLPSGVYQSLRITIGAGEGRNWWCVMFPQLCFGAAAEDAVEVGGMDQPLSGTISRQQGYEVRFFLLDILGKIENFFHRG